MNENYEFILKQVKLLYNAKLVKENTNGSSGNKIFEVETGQEAFILRVSKFTQKTKEHTEFELQWLDSLGVKSTM